MKITAKILALLIALMLAAGAAYADGGMAETAHIPGFPDKAEYIDAEVQGDLHVERYRCGEEMLTVTFRGENPVSIKSESALVFAGAQTADFAVSAVESCCPGAIVITETKPQAQGGGYTPHAVSFIADNCAGTLMIADDRIVARDITYDRYFSDGILTYEGAVRTILFYRPGASVKEMELERDDGMLIYEGEAFVNGVEYEFEIHARDGRLLEWERD